MELTKRWIFHKKFFLSKHGGEGLTKKPCSTDINSTQLMNLNVEFEWQLSGKSEFSQLARTAPHSKVVMAKLMVGIYTE